MSSLTETVAPKPCNAWLNTNVHVGFAAAIRKAGYKLRKNTRQTVDETEGPTKGIIYDHPVIEVFHENEWLLMVMPDGMKFFPSESERDVAFVALPGVK